MFKGMKKVLAGLLAATIALTPVSAVAADTGSPTVYLGPVTKKTNSPYYNAVKKQILVVDTANDGLCSIEKVNPNTTTVTYTAISVYNGKYYTVQDGKKVATGDKGLVQYKVARVNKGAFVGAKKVKKVVLGSRFRTLDYKAFAGATSLRVIWLKSSKLNRVSPNLFGNSVDPSKVHVYVSKNLTASQLKAIKLKLRNGGVWASHVHRHTDW
jgi:hypothetical protein